MSAGKFAFAEKRIHVVKVPRISYQKRNNYTVVGPDGTRRPANRQMARKVTRPFGFISDGNNEKVLRTGLDEYVINPFYGVNDLDEIPASYRPKGSWENKWDDIRKKSKLTRQTLYEILDNVDEGTYRSDRNMPVMTSPNVSARRIENIEPTFLETFKVHLNEGTNVFKNSSQRGRLGILVLENHPKVAPSKEEADMDPNRYDFYIASAEEVLEESERRDSKYMEVIVRLSEVLENYDPFIAYQFAVACRAIKGNIGTREATRALREYIMDSKRIGGVEQTDRWDMFNRIYVAFKNDTNTLYALYLVREAYMLGLFKDVSGKIIWATQKARENLYDLGVNFNKMVEGFYQAMSTYDPDLDLDNMYAILEREVKQGGAPTR